MVNIQYMYSYRGGNSYKDGVYMYNASICISHCIFSVSFRLPLRVFITRMQLVPMNYRYLLDFLLG